MADILQVMQQADGKLRAVGDGSNGSRPLQVQIVGGDACTCSDLEKRLADLEAEVAAMQTKSVARKPKADASV